MEPQRQTPRLAVLLHELEARLFSKFAEILRETAEAFQGQAMPTATLEAIRAILQEVLDDAQLSITVKGSAAKGTQSRTSDIDLLIETSRPVSVEDKERVVERMRNSSLINRSHVHLKRLAITCVMGESPTEVDLVFASTVEHGELPRGSKRFDGNHAAQRCARVLKVCMTGAVGPVLPIQLPGFVIELLILEAQDANRVYPKLQDGSLHLFVDTLQLLVDQPVEFPNTLQKRIFLNHASDEWVQDGQHGEQIATATCNSIRELARRLLSRFCASRAYLPGGEGFTTLPDLERWLRSFDTHHMVQTPFGPMPLWLMGGDGDTDDLYTFYCLKGNKKPQPGTRTLAECDNEGHMNTHARILAGGQLARYAQLAKTKGRTIRDTFVLGGCNRSDTILQLQHMWPTSDVAKRMLLARTAWQKGETALLTRQLMKAIDFFALALRFSATCDDDPFGGCFAHASSGGVAQIYYDAADFVCRVARHVESIVAAKVVRAQALVSDSNPVRAEKELCECIAICPDSIIAHRLRCVLRGAVNNWLGAKEDADRCIMLAPDDPIHRFWRASALRNIHGDPVSSNVTLQIDEDLVQFTSVASAGGRKVCQGFFGVALNLMRSCNFWSMNKSRMQRALDACQRGFEAEAEMLSLLHEYQKSSSASGAKTACIQLVTLARMAVEHGQLHVNLPATPIGLQEQLRQRANQHFTAHSYELAVQAYSSHVKLYPRDHSAFSNRSAAFTRLREFRRAEQDALKAISLAPTWPKASLRLATARLYLRDAQGAKEALDSYQACGGESRVLRYELESLLNQPIASRVDATQLSCWSAVQYKESVRVVDLLGCGDTVSLREAIVDAGMTPTTIIVLKGYHVVWWPTDSSRVVQIIGEGTDVSIARDTCSASFFIIQARGENSQISIENVRLSISGQPREGPVHCAVCTGGATLVVKTCQAFSTAACFAANDRSTLILFECSTVQGAGGGAVATGSSFIVARACSFDGLEFNGIDAREGSSFNLFNCHLTRVSKRAVNLYQDGVEGVMEDCIVTDCGLVHECPAVWCSTGTLWLRRCRVEENNSDGVVVQQSNGTMRAELVLSDCIVRSNQQAGIVVRGGTASVHDCRIQENAGFGLMIQDNTLFEGEFDPIVSATVIRNVILGNGSEQSGADACLLATAANMTDRVRMSNNTGNTHVILVRYEREDYTVEFGHAWCRLEPEKLSESLFLRNGEPRFTFLDSRHGETYDVSEKTLIRETERWLFSSHAPVTTDDFAAVHFNKKALIQAQERRVDSAEASMASSEEGVPQTTPGPSASNRRVSDHERELRSCCIHELTASIGRFAIGRILYGTLSTRPARIVSLMTILEDDQGAAVMIALYNIPATTTRRWREFFPKGLRLGIKEPFLKRFADGTIGVRVDDPKDVVYLWTFDNIPKRLNAETEGPGFVARMVHQS